MPDLGSAATHGQAGVRWTRRDGLIAILSVPAVALLCSLGAWQVERLQWKNALVATIDARIHAPPLPISEVARRAASGEEIDYVPATAAGTFDHAGERYALSTFDGQAGWNVYTPLRLAGGGGILFVNRGFVPYALKDPAGRAAGNPAGPVAIGGLARAGSTAKPSMFTPDNDPAQNVFFSRDVAQMAQGIANPEGLPVLPLVLDAGPGRAEGGWPVGGTTVVEIPNNHLQYAITWFGLAAVLVAMLAGAAVRRFRRRPADG